MFPRRPKKTHAETFNLAEHLVKILNLAEMAVLKINVEVSHNDRPKVTIQRYLTQSEANLLGDTLENGEWK